ncbi:MAG TPA: calcium/sodium antiporter [Myxococcota bacterium]|nr:calcium/sodium antiporter [Myxococcota bacterium]
MSWLMVLVGIVLLLAGGELVVRGAGRLAMAAGLSPLVVGLTVVAFCTSAPELAASVVAATKGTPEIALGNVIGSNIANIGLILGLAGLVRPFPVHGGILMREMPLVIGATALFGLVAWDGEFSRGDGSVLLVALVVYLGWMLRSERGKGDAELEKEYGATFGKGGVAPVRQVALVLVGVALLVGGAELLVEGAVAIATAAGLSTRVIGLTVVAIGTSLPELASSLIAAWKKEGDIVLGNVLGSNIFNVLGILGVTALVHPFQVDLAAAGFDLWVLVIFSVALLPIFWAGSALRRWEAAFLVTGYCAYIARLFWGAEG